MGYFQGRPFVMIYSENEWTNTKHSFPFVSTRHTSDVENLFQEFQFYGNWKKEEESIEKALTKYYSKTEQFSFIHIREREREKKKLFMWMNFTFTKLITLQNELVGIGKNLSHAMENVTYIYSTVKRIYVDWLPLYIVEWKNDRTKKAMCSELRNLKNSIQILYLIN